MYPENNEERKENQQPQYDVQQPHYDAHPPQYDMYTSQYNTQQPVYDVQQPHYIDPVYNAPVYEPVYNTPAHTPVQAPVQAPVQIPGHQPVNTPGYNGHIYNEPIYTEPIYTEQRDVPWSMYPPPAGANQPYIHPQTGNQIRPPVPRERKKRLGGFLRAVCLVLVCSLFSAAAAYAVMDFRFSRGDFTINRVVLGGSIADVQPDNNPDNDPDDPVTTLTGNITAQDIYDMALKQVVGIVTEVPGMFGLPGNESSPISGSGFIISADGYILTNYHVIEMAHRNNLPLSVVLNDGSSYDAEIIGFEESSDVAVIKIDAPGLTPALIGDSDNIRVGQTIYAVGNPFGDLVYTMTDGIISALDRVVSVEGKSINAFQFSAAVNRGNSGGPIYDENGEVLGIVTAKIVRGNVEGIGFAIPINDAIDIASALIEYGYISGRPLLGITAQTVSPANAEFYDMVVGTYVRSVNPGSAAEKAGIKVGDVITSLAGTEITSMEDLRFALRDHSARDTAAITVWRDGEHLELMITFDEDMHAGRPQIRPLPEPQTPDPFEVAP